MRLFLLSAMATMLWSGSLQAQTLPSSSAPKPLKIGLGMNGTMYRGDLSDDETLFHRIYPGGNVSLQTEGFSSLKLQLNVGFGKFG